MIDEDIDSNCLRPAHQSIGLKAQYSHFLKGISLYFENFFLRSNLNYAILCMAFQILIDKNSGPAGERGVGGEKSHTPIYAILDHDI